MTEIYREDISHILSDSAIPWENLRDRDILVTGATGLLGKLAVKTLVAFNRNSDAGCRIHALVRDKQKAKTIFEEELREGTTIGFIISDIRDFTDFDGPLDYILHAAAETASKAFVEQPVEMLETAIKGTANLLHMAREKDISGMVFLSTMEVYGTPQTDEKITEDRVLETKSQEIRSSYAIGKIAAENLCLSYAKEYGVPVNVLRLTQTFGAGVSPGDARVFAEFARCVIEERDIVLKTKGETKRSYLYTADALRAVFLVLLQTEKTKKGTLKEIYNIANEETYCSVSRMAERVLKAFGADDCRVIYDLQENTEQFGYAPPLCMNLDTKKIRSRGWEATYGLEEMYRRMIEDMRMNPAEKK